LAADVGWCAASNGDGGLEAGNLWWYNQWVSRGVGRGWKSAVKRLKFGEWGSQMLRHTAQDGSPPRFWAETRLRTAARARMENFMMVDLVGMRS
jgi:hypothetical protein